jgi:uncharacterized metal-binding protein
MLRFALRFCKTPIFLATAIVIPFQVLSILAQDFNILPGLFPLISETLPLWGYLPFLILPFYLGVLTHTRFQAEIPVSGGRGAWNLGVASILLPTATSVILSLVHYVFGLSTGSLAEAEGNALAVNLVVGLIASLWAGAVLGWLGYLVARILQPRKRNSAG